MFVKQKFVVWEVYFSLKADFVINFCAKILRTTVGLSYALDEELLINFIFVT